MLTWQIPTNLENCIAEYLESQIIAENITLLNTTGAEVIPSIRVGREVNTDWTLPLIQLYFDSTPVIKDIEIGSNLKEKEYLIILDIRCLLPGQEINLGQWVEDTLNNGFIYYTYQPNTLDVLNPIKTQAGYVSLKYITSKPLDFGVDADLYDKYRYRLAIQCWIS